MRSNDAPAIREEDLNNSSRFLRPCSRCRHWRGVFVPVQQRALACPPVGLVPLRVGKQDPARDWRPDQNTYDTTCSRRRMFAEMQLGTAHRRLRATVGFLAISVRLSSHCSPVTTH